MTAALFYRKYPHAYFENSPAMFSHPYDRFEEVAQNGSQKVLWTMLNNLTRDWYWFLCKEFGIQAHKIDVGFFPKKNIKHWGDSTFYIVGEFPQRTLTRHFIRYDLVATRFSPDIQYFDTIPHEVCHAIASQIYLNEINNVGHNKEWKEIMEYIGLKPLEAMSMPKDKVESFKTYTEIIQPTLSKSYANEVW